jgi:hypothetical protein
MKAWKEKMTRNQKWEIDICESLFINENDEQPLRIRSREFGNVSQMNAASQEAEEAKTGASFEKKLL